MASEAAEPAQAFSGGAYCGADGFLSPDVAALASRYALMQAGLGPSRGDSQVRQSHARYADPLMECLLEEAWPRIEALCGVELWPAYAYHRVYFPGAELPMHRDRPSCEISASICLGFEYVGVDSAYRWPLRVEAGGRSADFASEPGALVLYEGCILEHGRAPFTAGEGSWHAQLFLHFVRRAGRFAICRFDGRPRLGLPASSADPELEARILELEREVLGPADELVGSRRS